MNIDNIKEIVGASVPDNLKRRLILVDIAKDDNCIIDILEIIEQERKVKKQLINDMNLELSRSHCYIQDRKESVASKSKRFNKAFLMKSIEDFYEKYKGVVTHCFNQFN